jgi:PAS domain-containing protein
MYGTTAEEGLVQTAVHAIVAENAERLRQLDEAPAPLYVTDPEGIVTYFNKACIEFAGRIPAVRRDRWCVTWKLYTPDGVFLPHDQCPMAIAIKEKRWVRGVTAFAERPDGSRRSFLPYPTPVLDESGKLLAAVNAFAELSHSEHLARLRAEAARHSLLARSVSDDRIRAALLKLAAEYERMITAFRRPPQ